MPVRIGLYDLAAADIRELTSRDDLAFLTSPDRMTEAEALCRIGRKEAVNV